jgi:hypothetical protein
VPSGKTKFRRGDEVVSEVHPGTELVVFDLSPSRARPGTRRHPLHEATHLVAAVSPDRNALVLVVTGEGETRRFLVVDAASGKVLDRRPARGVPVRLERRPGF